MHKNQKPFQASDFWYISAVPTGNDLFHALNYSSQVLLSFHALKVSSALRLVSPPSFTYFLNFQEEKIDRTCMKVTTDVNITTCGCLLYCFGKYNLNIVKNNYI